MLHNTVQDRSTQNFSKGYTKLQNTEYNNPSLTMWVIFLKTTKADKITIGKVKVDAWVTATTLTKG
jgi:hypothetical protein